MADWVPTLGGALVVLVILGDAYLSIFHYDLDGPVGQLLRRTIWSGLIRLGGTRRAFRRLCLGLAGPLLLGLTFLLWIGGVIVGFALVIWPHLSTAYRSDPELTLGSFVDALYYSGITASVLGHGDITPTTAPFKVLAFCEAAIGFFLFTATITYAINIVGGATQRNALATRVRAMGGDRWDGIALATRILPSGPDQLATRSDGITRELALLQEKLHQFPLLDLYYRSQREDRDPEPALACLIELTLAMYLLGEIEPVLRRPAEELEASLDRMMSWIAEQHFTRSQQRALALATHDTRDEERLQGIRRQIEESRSAPGSLNGTELPTRALEFSARAQLFLDALDRHTRWRVDHGEVGQA